MSAAWHAAGRRQPCDSFHSTFEDRVKGRKRSSSGVTETIDTTRKVVEHPAEAASLGERDRSARRQEIQSEIYALLSQQFLAKWRLCLADMCGGEGAVAKNTNSSFRGDF